jgi:hypothetical protein
LAETTQDEFDRADAIDALGEIGVGNEAAALALLRLLGDKLKNAKNNDRSDTRAYQILESLAKIGAESEASIRGLVHLLKATQNKKSNYRYRHSQLLEILEKIGSNNEAALLALVRAIPKPLRNEWSYRLMFKCAEALPYPKFYQAFHSSR